jgi:hypothetical protein
MADFGIAKTNFSYKLQSGQGNLSEIFDDNIPVHVRLPISHLPFS